LVSNNVIPSSQLVLSLSVSFLLELALSPAWTSYPPGRVLCNRRHDVHVLGRSWRGLCGTIACGMAHALKVVADLADGMRLAQPILF
ncbi:unnamed protein product, partial [Urochloa humidicola]